MKLPPLHVDPGPWLDMLRAKGLSKGRIKTEAVEIEFEFAPLAAEAAPLATGAKFVDEKGKAIDLDDGLPDLARDPLAEAYLPPSKGD